MKIQVEMAVQLSLYILLFLYFPSQYLKPILWGFTLSLVWKELIILTQHTHVEIPISGGEDVRPISYKEQIKYTRSFYVGAFFEKWFMFNFNMHEAHHAQPGLPAYYLGSLDLKTARNSYWNWFKQAKFMKGVDFIFKTSKHTGKQF
jgi:fatty acid desaturase